jgi:hypothetical protein
MNGPHPLKIDWRKYAVGIEADLKTLTQRLLEVSKTAGHLKTELEEEKAKVAIALHALSIASGLHPCPLYRDAIAVLKSTEPSEDTIEDGFGSAWSVICPECKEPAMEVVRPGKAQCGNCG